MHVTQCPTPTAILELAYDGWEVLGPLTSLWSPGRRYHATSPDGRTRLNAANYAPGAPFTYQLVTATRAEYWGLLAPTVTPHAITAAARAALSRGEPAAITETLTCAGWSAATVHGLCGMAIETTYTAPDRVTRAHRISRDHTCSPGSSYWLIEHTHGREPAMADTSTPAPVLAALLLNLARA